MRTILGLNFNHADSSVCLIKNGKLEYAVEEERINRVKHWSGVPYGAIKEALRYSKTDLGDIHIFNLKSDIKKWLTKNINVFGLYKHEYYNEKEDFQFKVGL